MSASYLQKLQALLGPTDEQLMWRVQAQDDASAFGELVGRWEKRIQALCSRYVGDPVRGEDLTQEVFARLYARRKNWRPDAKLSTYLWRIAINRCYDELRKTMSRREVPIDDQSSEEQTPHEHLASKDLRPDESLARAESCDLVRLAVQQLPEQYRLVVVLRHYEDLTFREIAEVLAIPEGTVKTRMTEALNRLARRLRPDFGRPAGSPLGNLNRNNKPIFAL